jgi:hypothetical protein
MQLTFSLILEKLERSLSSAELIGIGYDYHKFTKPEDLCKENLQCL